MYFVDFVTVSLVSWRAIIEGSVDGCLIRSWRFGRAVVKEATFQVIIWLGCVVWVEICGVGGGENEEGRGC
jgi:hypothetical protein